MFQAHMQHVITTRLSWTPFGSDSTLSGWEFKGGETCVCACNDQTGNSPDDQLRKQYLLVQLYIVYHSLISTSKEEIEDQINYPVFFFLYICLLGMTQLMRKLQLALRLTLWGSPGPTA